MKENNQPYAVARHIEDIHDCFFYHTMDLPGYGTIEGLWDLRGRVDAYLGHVGLGAKRVLEVGTASGFLCFEMEHRGAEVVAYDLSESDHWDLVPYGGRVPEVTISRHCEHIRCLNNGWWLAHRVLESKAHVVYGSVYDIPAAIGPVDIVTFGCILLHLRDPFLALQQAGLLAKEAIIVTDMKPTNVLASQSPSIVKWALNRLFMRGSSQSHVDYLLFLPDIRKAGKYVDTWWQLPAETIVRFLEVLGFPNTHITYHKQRHVSSNQELDLYTVVGKRS